MNNYIFITAAGITMSLSEGLYKWMLFPDVQRLMDITVHCSGKFPCEMALGIPRNS